MPGTDAQKVAAIATVVLYGKYCLTTILQGTKKEPAGLGPTEDGGNSFSSVAVATSAGAPADKAMETALRWQAHTCCTHAASIDPSTLPFGALGNFVGTVADTLLLHTYMIYDLFQHSLFQISNTFIKFQRAPSHSIWPSTTQSPSPAFESSSTTPTHHVPAQRPQCIPGYLAPGVRLAQCARPSTPHCETIECPTQCNNRPTNHRKICEQVYCRCATRPTPGAPRAT